MEKKFRSIILWPKGVLDIEHNRSEDQHETRDQAQAVCDTLMKEGNALGMPKLAYVGTTDDIMLNNWAFAPRSILKGAVYLTGDVVNHPRIGDAKGVTTTRIVGEDDGILLTKSGSRYELGPMDPEFEELFPRAVDMIFKSIKVRKEKL